METNKKILNTLITDIKNGTSHSVDFLLSSEIEKTLSKKGIKVRKIFAPMLRQVYSFKTRYRLKIDKSEKIKPIKNNIGGGEQPKSKGKIYVVNHRQADDIVLGVRAVADSGYIVFGNRYLALETLDGLGLWAYGMILMDRNDDLNRESTYNKMKYVIENGGNIIIWSEGYWNLDDDGQKDERHEADAHNSENWLIQDINVGAVRLAQETGSPLIPTILHYDEFKKKRCYAKRGNPFVINKDDDLFAKKDEFVETMQTMYYLLMEKYSSYERTVLEADGLTLKEQWEMLKEELRSACDIPKIEYQLDLKDEKLIGKAKVANPVITKEEVTVIYEKPSKDLIYKMEGVRKVS